MTAAIVSTAVLMTCRGHLSPLPRFLAAFTSQVRLTPEEVAQLQEIIRQNGEEGEPRD